LITQDNLFAPARRVDEDVILLTHEKEYWEQLRDQTISAKDARRIGFPMSPRLIERSARISQGTIEGSLHAIENRIAFNAAGGTHHAGSNWGEGFCMLNDQAIAANYLLKNQLASRILIVDLDVHQGNGTAQIFENEPRVFTFSMHGANNFPFRKEKSDLDIPLPDGMMDDEYLRILYDTLPKLITQHQPDFIFYLAGVDILATDKLGKFAISREGCKARDKFVLEQCHKNNIPVQISMGGGYSTDIRDIVEAHCNTYRLAVDLYF